MGVQQVLDKQISDKIFIDPDLTRKVVSYQANRSIPGFRWLRYKEGFSVDLVSKLLSGIDAKSILDPFSGIGTTVLTASRLGIKATGIEIMPIGNNTVKAIMAIAKDIKKQELETKFTELLDSLGRNGIGTPFNHIRITRDLFGLRGIGFYEAFS